MRFDLFHELSMPPQGAVSEVQAVADWLEAMQLADQLGFGCAWLVEHHFMRGYSHSSKPEILLGAAAQCTQRLRLGLGVIPAPYHHPIHSAERVATLDVLSNGRLEVGLGRGFSPREYQAFGVDMQHSRELTQATLDILRLSFAREPVSYQGRQVVLDQVDILPHVVQQPHPPLWSAAVSPESFEWSAQQGLGVLTGPFKPWFMTRADIQRYQTAWRAATPPRIGMTLGILCLPDGKRAKQLAKPAFEWFYRALLQTVRPVLEQQYPSYEHFRELGRFRAVLERGINARLLQTFGMVIAGTPTECIERLAEYQEQGVTHILLAIGAGAVSSAVAQESMRCIAADVMPALQV